jgi:hypothetical protein
MKGHVHSILSDRHTAMLSLKVRAAKLTRIAWSSMLLKKGIPYSMLSEGVIVIIPPVVKDSSLCQQKFAT